jgi:N-acetylmuramoyl-L-alanine amidase
VQDDVSGVYPITGWAIDDVGVRTNDVADVNDPYDVEVLIDGQGVGQVIYGLPRPDVANAHPDVAGALLSGWQMNLDTTRFDNGSHTLSVRAWDTQGLSTTLGTRTVNIDNNYATLRPFGRIDWPMPDGHFFALNCYNPPPLSGVPTQAGAQPRLGVGLGRRSERQLAQGGCRSVELLIDGVMIGDTSRANQWEQLPWGCFYFDYFDRIVNCYGSDRPDIARAYPQFGSDAKQAGFFFAVDTEYLLQLGFPRGLHYLSIRAVTFDETRPAVVIDKIPVVFDCNDQGDAPPFGDLEIQVNMQDMKNTELVKGWVIDYNSVRQLNFYVDGILDGSLIACPSVLINQLRLDVEAAYPWLPYPFSRFNGFEYQLDTSKYVDGVHQLIVEAVDVPGHTAYWVQRPVVFNNVN